MLGFSLRKEENLTPPPDLLNVEQFKRLSMDVPEFIQEMPLLFAFATSVFPPGSHGETTISHEAKDDIVTIIEFTALPGIQKFAKENEKDIFALFVLMQTFESLIESPTMSWPKSFQEDFEKLSGPTRKQFENFQNLPK